MARRKRASMREGPLADLFRSTARDQAEEETRVTGDREAASFGARAHRAARSLASSPRLPPRIPSACAPTGSRSASH